MPIFRAGFMMATRDHWVARIGALNIVIGKIGHLSELATDPQAIANNFVQPVTFSSGKTIAMPTVPVEFSAYDTGKAYEPTGAVGRDTDEVLTGMGYTAIQIAELKANGAAK